MLTGNRENYPHAPLTTTPCLQLKKDASNHYSKLPTVNLTDVRKSKVSHYQPEFMMLQFNHFFNYLIILKIPI